MSIILLGVCLLPLETMLNPHSFVLLVDFTTIRLFGKAYTLMAEGEGFMRPCPA